MNIKQLQMNNKCLYCYKALNDGKDYHDKCALSFFGSTQPPKIEYSLNEMDKLAASVIERRIAVPGVQPKLSMSLVKEATEKNESRLTIVGALGGQYIFKPPSQDFPQMPENEHLTMRIAEALGLNVVPSSLIRLKSGELSYITKRIDRTDQGDKIHMIDFFQITEAFDKYKSSLEKVGKALKTYSSNPLLDLTYYFDFSLFAFITGNNDMHLKNFSMIKSPSGWILAPAYDLLNVSIVLPEDNEELALSLTSKKRKLKPMHFEKLGKNLGLTSKQIKNAFKRLLKHQPLARAWIESSFLSESLKADYINLMESRYSQLGMK
jgi:serine/threonine-protein kinase HipA